MFLSKLKGATQLAAVALLVTSLGGWGVGAFMQAASFDNEKASAQAADGPISLERFEKLHRIILPQDGELKWLSVPWLTSITLAQHQAAVENKPLFVIADTGAGFADALGLC